MPPHLSFLTASSRDIRLRGSAFSQALAVGCVAFNEAELAAMTLVVDEVCAEIPGRNRPQEREFVAWLVVRLSRNGICDPARVKAATLEAMRPRLSS